MKTFLHARGAFILILILSAIASCKKQSVDTPQYPIPSNIKMISSGYAAGAATKVEIYAASSLFVGYNKLYIALYDSATNARITQAQVSFSVTTQVGSNATLQAPVENPAGTQATSGLFDGAAVFTLPTTTDSNSTLAIQVQGLANQKSGTYVTTAAITQPWPAKAYSATAQNDGSMLFVCLVQPGTPQLGTNTFEIAIYKQTSTQAFVPATGYQVNSVATMPGMEGMNAPNNVNPAYTADGHYAGKINFIMTGYWQIDLSLLNNGVVADSTHYFALNL